MVKWTHHKADTTLVNALISRYRTDNFAIFKSEGEKHAFVQSLLSEKSKAWSSQGQCYFPECTNKSVKASHSLSNSMMVQPISDDKHVLTPQVNHHTGEYEFVRVGVNEASVFPGFCEEHEQSFTFEQKGVVSNGSELQMHLFRAICRDIHFLENEKFEVARNREEVSKRLRADLTKQLENTPPSQTHVDVIVDGIEAELIENMDLLCEQRQKNIDFVQQNWFAPNAEKFGETISDEFYDELIQTAEPMHIALSAATHFDDTPRDHEGTPDFEYLYYVNIFPNNGKTLIHLVAKKSMRERLTKLADTLEADGAATTNYVEKWMIEASDHWYIKPSYWDSVDAEIQTEVLKALKGHLMRP